jgi:hypothetical protein
MVGSGVDTQDGYSWPAFSAGRDGLLSVGDGEERI